MGSRKKTQRNIKTERDEKSERNKTPQRDGMNLSLSAPRLGNTRNGNVGNGNTWIGIVLGVVFVLLMTVTLSRKNNFHVDEIFSYGLSNNQLGTVSMQFDTGTRYQPSQAPFLEYVAAKGWNRFDYETVWNLQTADVHPPLYYAVLHTICSLSVNRFSVWQAGLVNILFGLFAMVYLRRLLRLLIEGEAAVNLCTVVFIGSAGILNAVSFLRMYVMAMFWVVLLSYLFVRQTTVPAGEGYRWKFYLKITLATICGALTHYYCIVYAVLISVVFGIYLLCAKRWKDTLFFCGSMAVAGGASYLIFPAMVEHIFHGQRGEQSFENLSNAEDRMERLKVFYGFLNHEMFGGLLTYLLAGIALLLLYAIFSKKVQGIIAVRYLMILLPCVAFFGLVSKTAVYQTDRYLFPIYAVSLGCLFGLAIRFLQKLWNPKWMLFAAGVLGVFILWGSWHKTAWEYLYLNDRPHMEAAQECAGLDCICIYDGSRWKVQANLQEYVKYNSITFWRAGNYDPAQLAAQVQTQGVVVSTVGNVDAEGTLAQLREYLPQYEECSQIGSYGYSNSYVLR